MNGPTDQERLAVVHLQVADVTDRSGQCYVYCYRDGHYRYVNWSEAIDLLMQNRGSLADPPGQYRSPFERMD